MKEQRTASITIRRDGVKQFTLPIVSETSHGFVCRTGPNDSPATEHFAFNSPCVSCHEILPKN